ncbi:MAG: hypothetical protein DRP42_06125, partial [Tenericutes bacterium]
NDVLELVFPVGSIRMGSNPTGLIPGTWAQVPEGTFIMSTVGGTDASGGNNETTLNTSNLSAHNHDIGHTHSQATSGEESVQHEHSGSTLSFDGVALASHDHDTAVAPWIASGVISTGATQGLSGDNASAPITMPKTSSVSSGTPEGTISGKTGTETVPHTHAVTVPAHVGNSGNSGSATPFSNRPKYIGREMWERTA